MNTNKDPKTGRFVSTKVTELIQRSEELSLESKKLEQQAQALIQAEKEAPEWLKTLVVNIATSLGITAEDFNERVRVVHPTPQDPVLLVDGKALVAWI